MPTDRQSPSQMNIVIKAITDIDESSSVAGGGVTTAGKSMGSLHHDDSKDSLYDQIKKKYMQQQPANQVSSESLNLVGIAGGSYGSGAGGSARQNNSNNDLDIKLKQMRHEAANSNALDDIAVE